MRGTLGRALLLLVPVVLPAPSVSQTDGITIISDAFGGRDDLHHDGGYSALVEVAGHRILFDTGNDAARFASNAEALGIDLTDLDAVVISHRHGDHTDGLHHLRDVNPTVRVYAPGDEYFGGATPAVFFRRTEPGLPPEQRYFRGAVPAVVPHGTPWRGFDLVSGAGGTEIAPGIRLVENVAPGRDFGETPELTLVVETANGRIVLVGCSHPGIERILASIGAPTEPVALLVGGLHLLTQPDAEVDALAGRLRAEWGVRRIAPGHCSGEHAFVALRGVFGDRFEHAGVGTVLRWR